MQTGSSFNLPAVSVDANVKLVPRGLVGPAVRGQCHPQAFFSKPRAARHRALTVGQSLGHG